MPVSLTQASKWIRLSADQGEAQAQAVLGRMHLQGVGVEKDLQEAQKWFRLAAEKGQALALNGLGALYSQGLGVAQDGALAYALFSLAVAAPRDDDYQAYRQNLETMRAHITPEQAALGEKIAREWKPGTPLPRSSSGYRWI